MRFAEIILMLAASCAVCGCGGRNAANKGAQTAPPQFEMIEVPAMISDPGQRAEYIAKHYWDNFDFGDTSYIGHPEITEQALSNFLYALDQMPLPRESVAAAMKGLMAKAEADSAMFAHFGELTEKYLYDANSPMMNEELYIPVLEYIVASKTVGELEKTRPRYQLEMAMKNRAGEKATDFEYATIGGGKSSLYGTKGDFTMLFLNNPGCPACAETIEAIKESPTLDGLINGGIITVLAVYPDENLEEWRADAAKIPAKWINAYDPGAVLKGEELYDLKAIPTLYLLDRDKRVLFKDAPVGRIEAYFAS